MGLVPAAAVSSSWASIGQRRLTQWLICGDVIRAQCGRFRSLLPDCQGWRGVGKETG